MEAAGTCRRGRGSRCLLHSTLAKFFCPPRIKDGDGDREELEELVLLHRPVQQVTGFVTFPAEHAVALMNHM